MKQRGRNSERLVSPLFIKLEKKKKIRKKERDELPLIFKSKILNCNGGFSDIFLLVAFS